jgi:hypothetical protein
MIPGYARSVLSNRHHDIINRGWSEFVRRIDGVKITMGPPEAPVKSPS